MNFNKIALLLLVIGYIKTNCMNQTNSIKRKLENIKSYIENERKIKKIKKHDSLIKEIKQTIANNNNIKIESVNSLLFSAIQNDNEDAIKLLINSGTNLNILNKSYDYTETPLTVAIATNKIEIVKLLIHSGANPNFPDNRGTPIMHAAFNGRKEIMQLLIDNGANLNFKTGPNNDYTALILAAQRHSKGESMQQKNNYEEIIELLIRNGADMETLDCYKRIVSTNHIDNPETIEALLKIQNKHNIQIKDKLCTFLPKEIANIILEYYINIKNTDANQYQEQIENLNGEIL